MTAPLWSPSPERVAATQLAAFAARHGFDGYEALHRWSVERPDEFWSAVWTFAELRGTPGDVVIAPGGTMAATRFFPEARLNVAEEILWGRGAADDDVMYLSIGEGGGPEGTTAGVAGAAGVGSERVWTRGEVRSLVSTLAEAMRSEGVEPGDRIAAWMPNIAETMIVMLAAAAIGAVFSSTSPDFGVDGVLDRFGQIEPVMLFAADGYRYGGRSFDCVERLREIRAALPSVRRVVVIGYRDGAVGAPDPSIDTVADAVAFDTFVAAAAASAAPAAAERRPFERFDFDHPWYVLYSSGTTGPPKCIVHRTGGVLLQHIKEHRLHCDIRPGDRAMYFTTCGWMMWNWLASVPASGATAVLYDGSPFHPDPDAIPALAERVGLTFLGVGAKYLDSLRKADHRPVDHHDLRDLRTIASTGSPLAPESFEWVSEAFPPDIHLASISGGTDLCGCFVLGDPTSPVYAGEIQRPGLGMAVDVVDDHGRPAPLDERGELVCTQAFPSMPLGFWGDADGSRYRAAYFDKHPGIWSHGDFASWTTHGGMIVHGRSDTTLNPGGVRIGTAEIYRRVEVIDDVIEALVFGQQWDDDVRVVLAVRLRDGAPLDAPLVEQIRRVIRTGCTPRHVPAVIVAVRDLPRTRSGKLAELAVTDAVNGRPVRNTSALANPDAIDEIVAAVADWSAAHEPDRG